jgi:N-acetylneuraminic acid mutarotase
MDPFHIAKNTWSPGDTREVEQSRVKKEIGMEYDSYRRVYIADGHEWQIVGQIARDDGKKYYIFECIE